MEDAPRSTSGSGIGRVVPHCYIAGMTESGKSSLAKRMVREYKKRGISALVLDPMNDPSWGADFQTANVDEFLRMFYSSRSCAVFIDESAEVVGQYDDTMIRTATKGRHWGHNCHYISQRGVGVSRTVRDQCRKLFLFTIAAADAKTFALEYNQPILARASVLPQFEYFSASRFGEIKRGSLKEE